jgi:hypothetical protein
MFCLKHVADFDESSGIDLLYFAGLVKSVFLEYVLRRVFRHKEVEVSGDWKDCLLGGATVYVLQ